MTLLQPLAPGAVHFRREQILGGEALLTGEGMGAGTGEHDVGRLGHDPAGHRDRVHDVGQESHRTGLAAMIHDAGVEGHPAIAIGVATEAHRVDRGVGFGHPRRSLDGIQCVAATGQTGPGSLVGLQAETPGAGDHGAGVIVARR